LGGRTGPKKAGGGSVARGARGGAGVDGARRAGFATAAGAAVGSSTTAGGAFVGIGVGAAVGAAVEAGARGEIAAGAPGFAVDGVALVCGCRLAKTATTATAINAAAPRPNHTSGGNRREAGAVGVGDFGIA
jgi:hypothetical protein